MFVSIEKKRLSLIQKEGYLPFTEYKSDGKIILIDNEDKIYRTSTIKNKNIKAIYSINEFIQNIKYVNEEQLKILIDNEEYESFYSIVSENEIETEVLNNLLIYTASNGYLDVVKYLAENGADIGTEDNKTLRWSAEYGFLDVVKYLVQSGANIKADDNYALRCSAENGFLDVVKYLIDNGANIRADDNYALRCSLENGHLNVVEYLIKNGADIKTVDDYEPKWSVHDGLDI